MSVAQGVVIYVAAEAPRSVQNRLWAWKQHHGIKRLPVLVVQSSVDLLNGDADATVELVAQTARDHGLVALVVVDTLARSMTGNENSPDDMGRYVTACARIREAAETHVLVVHHSGKDLARGARGHSSLRAASDTELEVTKAERGGCLAITKNRDEEDLSRFGFRLEPVPLGINAKGREVTTCVAVEAEVTGQVKKVSLTTSSAPSWTASQPPSRIMGRTHPWSATSLAKLAWCGLRGGAMPLCGTCLGTRKTGGNAKTSTGSFRPSRPSTSFAMSMGGAGRRRRERTNQAVERNHRSEAWARPRKPSLCVNCEPAEPRKPRKTL
jgi:hypothetical protein